jgi:hypothetical protein
MDKHNDDAEDQGSQVTAADVSPSQHASWVRIMDWESSTYRWREATDA